MKGRYWHLPSVCLCRYWSLLCWCRGSHTAIHLELRCPFHTVHYTFYLYKVLITSQTILIVETARSSVLFSTFTQTGSVTFRICLGMQHFLCVARATAISPLRQGRASSQEEAWDIPQVQEACHAYWLLLWIQCSVCISSLLKGSLVHGLPPCPFWPWVLNLKLNLFIPRWERDAQGVIAYKCAPLKHLISALALKE